MQAVQWHQMSQKWHLRHTLYFVFSVESGVSFLFPFRLFWVAVMWHNWFLSPLPWQHLSGSQQPPSVQLWVSFGRKPMRVAQFVTRHPINVSGVRLGVGRSVIVPMKRSREGCCGDVLPRGYLTRLSEVTLYRSLSRESHYTLGTLVYFFPPYCLKWSWAGAFNLL